MYPASLTALLADAPALNDLGPGKPLVAMRKRLAEFDLVSAVGPERIVDQRFAQACQSGLWLRFDFLDESHEISQSLHNATGSYWHGIMHRREADFDNARYWFRTAGELPTFGKMHAAASESSPTMARQESWDPYLFTGMCEQAKFGAEELVPECQALQRAEFEVLFDYCWRQAIG